MAIGFGFSVSDLCMGLRLIKESVASLDDRTGAASDYGALLGEIGSLQEGLQAVEQLTQTEQLPEKHRVALERAVMACEECIEDFLDSISKYQPHLRAVTKGFIPKFRKMQWALCRKDDLAKFRSQLGRHSSAINMLLITFQAQQSLAGRASNGGQVVTTGAEKPLLEMMQTMSLEQRQCFMFVMQQNQELLRTIQDMRTMLELHAAVPPQILLQQPVVLLDPFGKLAPFHLDFIDSSECFKAVLHARFANTGVSPGGLSKLTNGEFVIEDIRSKRKIDLAKPWPHVFRPGQQIDMRMTFHRFACPPSTCPGCLEKNDDENEEIECQDCGLFYQNIQAISRQSREWELHLPKDQEFKVHGEQIPYILRHSRGGSELRSFHPSESIEDTTFDGYRRIQLISQPMALLDPLFPALQLIEDFVHFADLLDDVPMDISPYRHEIRLLHQRAKAFILEGDSDFPAFSSFSHIKHMRKRLTQESSTLRHYIDVLVMKLCNDEDTKQLLKFIKQKSPRSNRTGYYAGALNVVVNLTETAKTKGSRIPKPVSKDKMQWRMFSAEELPPGRGFA